MSHKTNKRRDIYRHTIEMANSWTTEYGVVILIPDSEFTSIPRLVEMANRELKIGGYDYRFTTPSIIPHLKKRWVADEYLHLDEWHKGAVRESSPGIGYVCVYMIDMEKVS